ncbi:MAG: hypothetical protein IKQ18_02510 [Clostridia bacterium]|nr:hypothetical protein [Clostridia bacterium]
MEQKKFEAMLILLVPQVVSIITEKHKCNELTATRHFYESKLYSLLEQEETKLWHLSAAALFELYDEEVRTGNITFPEEA